MRNARQAITITVEVAKPGKEPHYVVSRNEIAENRYDLLFVAVGEEDLLGHLQELVREVTAKVPERSEWT